MPHIHRISSWQILGDATSKFSCMVQMYVAPGPMRGPGGAQAYRYYIASHCCAFSMLYITPGVVSACLLYMYVIPLPMCAQRSIINCVTRQLHVYTVRGGGGGRGGGVRGDPDTEGSF